MYNLMHDEKKVICYLRTSTDKQSLEIQDKALKEYCKANNIPYQFYSDQKSGKDFAREGWQSLWLEVEAGKVKEILVYSLSRLGRTAIAMFELFEYLDKHKINLRSITEGLSLDSTAGKIMIQLYTVIAQIERERINELTKAGQKNSILKGTMYGKRARKCTVLTSTKVKAMQSMFKEGMSMSTIADVMDCSESSVYKAVRGMQSENQE